MTEKVLLIGTYAIAQAAVNAGCQMQELGRAYVCAESELAAINMVMGAVSTGVKAMTSSSSCAVALMQEALSYAAADELPVVLVNVMRTGPGLGYIYPAQGDYNQAVYGGGNGDYKIIVLAPPISSLGSKLQFLGGSIEFWINIAIKGPNASGTFVLR